MSGNTPPTTTIILPAGMAEALTVDATNHEIYVAVATSNNRMVYVYPTNASGNATPTRSFVADASGATVTGLGLDLTHNQLFVLVGNNIVVFARGDTGPTGTPLMTITPANIPSLTSLYGGVYDPIDDAIWVAWSAAGAGHAASYKRVASTAAASLYTPMSGALLLPMPQARGIWLQPPYAANSGFVWVASTDPSSNHLDAIYKFGRTNSVLLGGITGSSTLLYHPASMVLDSTNSEFWVVNGHDGAEAFRIADANNAPPQRTLGGASTGILDPSGIAVDRVNSELVLLQHGPKDSITAYPQSASNASVVPVTPARTISGPTTTLSGSSPGALTVDGDHGEYWVVENGYPALVAFPRTQIGNGAPVRTISGSTNVAAHMSTSSPGMVYDAKAGAVIIATNSPTVANQSDFLSWLRTDTGDVAPEADGSLTLANRQLYSLSIDTVNDLIFSGDGAKTSVFPRAFSSGSLSPLRSFNAPAGYPVVDSEGGEVYLYQYLSNRISVYPSSSTGTPSPTRTIQGSATQLYQTLQLTICN